MMKGGRRSIRLRVRRKGRERDMILESGGLQGRGHELACTCKQAFGRRWDIFCPSFECTIMTIIEVYTHRLCIEYKISIPAKTPINMQTVSGYPSMNVSKIEMTCLRSRTYGNFSFYLSYRPIQLPSNHLLFI